MKLNVKKIRSEMERLGITESDLARDFKTSRQNVWWMLNKGGRSFKVVQRFAKYFMLDEKDLIK